MKILVLSDSHSVLRFMRHSLRVLRPDAVIHLGDHYDDAGVLLEENPHLRLHQVPGNCDARRCPISAQSILCYPVGGVRMFMTHGHIHHVKFGIGGLLADARKNGAQAVLYGHTHTANCYQEPDGLWVLNPGACGSAGGSVGLIETDGEKIISCRVLRQEELEMMT